MSDAADELAALARAREAHETLLAGAERLAARGRDEAALHRVAAAARLAALAHTGRYADARAERLVLRIARARLPQRAAPPPAADAPRCVLHVATRVLPSGGHTRLLANWMANDAGSVHDLLLTDQPEGTVPAFVEQAATERGGRVRRLEPRASLLDRAMALRDAAYAGASLVVLHAHQFDVVPLLAFAAPGGPPVVVSNHSDHTSWLGVSVADAVANIRPFAQRLTEARRGVRSAVLLPIPLRLPETVPAREQARASLGLGPEDLALVTMGSRYKYQPTATHDFFATLKPVLERHERARLIVIGLTRAQAEALLPPRFPVDRLECAGVVPEPARYLVSADLFLEAFPYSSYLALLDAVVLGAPPVLMYAPSAQLKIREDPGLASTAETKTAEEYQRLIASLLADPEARRALGSRAREDTVREHAGPGWRERLERIYATVLASGHRPQDPADDAPRADEEDVLRAEWDALQFGRVPLMTLGARIAPTWREFAALLAQSLRLGDTRPRLHHARAWLWTARMRAGGPLE